VLVSCESLIEKAASCHTKWFTDALMLVGNLGRWRLYLSRDCCHLYDKGSILYSN